MNNPGMLLDKLNELTLLGRLHYTNFIFITDIFKLDPYLQIASSWLPSLLYQQFGWKSFSSFKFPSNDLKLNYLRSYNYSMSKFLPTFYFRWFYIICVWYKLISMLIILILSSWNDSNFAHKLPIFFNPIK